MYDIKLCACPNCGSSKLAIKQKQWHYYHVSAVDPQAGDVEFGCEIEEDWWTDNMILFCASCEAELEPEEILIKLEEGEEE